MWVSCYSSKCLICFRKSCYPLLSEKTCCFNIFARSYEQPDILQYFSYSFFPIQFPNITSQLALFAPISLFGKSTLFHAVAPSPKKSSIFREPFWGPWPLVEVRRVELLTPCLQGRCSPNWAIPPSGNGLKWTWTIDLTLIRRAL